VNGRARERVVIVVPAFAHCEETNRPLGGPVACLS
jgi:hypothetical protein